MSSVWRECMSSKYGRKYWFNEASGESVWEDPTTPQSSTVSIAETRQQDIPEKRHTESNQEGSHPAAKRMKSGSSSAVDEPEEIFEEPPYIPIERERRRDELLTYLCHENEKFGEMKGNTKTANSCRKEGMKTGLQGLFARVMWTQILNEIQTMGDVGDITRDVVFPSHFIRDEAVEKEFIDAGRTEEQSRRLLSSLGERFLRTTRELVNMRQSFSLSRKHSDVIELTAFIGHKSDRLTALASIPVTIDREHRYQLSVRGVNHYIRGEHFAKLLRLYRLHTDVEATLTDQLFLRRVFCVLTRYDTISGTSDGYQMAFPNTGFQWLRDNIGVKIECFASPLNCWNQRFCSVARDTDRFFGSLGNFFLFDKPTGRLTEDDFGLPMGGSFEANPPFVESVMNQMAERIEWLLETYPDIPYSFSVIVPAWDDCMGLQLMNNTKFARPVQHYKLVLPKRQHNYRPGMQQRADLIEQPSNVDTYVYFLQNDAGAKRWPVTVELANQLKDILAAEAGAKYK